MMQLHKAPSWGQTLQRLKRLTRSWSQVVRAATLTEAQHLRTLIVDGLTSQQPGDGEELRPLSPLTLAARRLRGFRGTKALLDRGDLRNSVAVVKQHDAAFVGVVRRATTPDGQPLADLAAVHEFGTPPTIIPLTPKMRRLIASLYAEAGLPAPSRVGGKGYVVVQVPERPFLRPAARKFKQGAAARFTGRLRQQMAKRGV